ncbi:hypothetical protein Leryth_000466 [Lithospermum erythrorhizon]|nr:hypothetical protein Leryth_000466 [Lithospermum erythrorhizon]
MEFVKACMRFVIRCGGRPLVVWLTGVEHSKDINMTISQTMAIVMEVCVAVNQTIIDIGIGVLDGRFVRKNKKTDGYFITIRGFAFMEHGVLVNQKSTTYDNKIHLLARKDNHMLDKEKIFF